MTGDPNAWPIPTACCVITAPPSAGKTKLIEALAARLSFILSRHP
jgi:hypothetical protein